MSSIFGYAGKSPCKDIILEGLCSLKGEAFELSGIAMKTGSKIECLKIKGTPKFLYSETKGVAENSALGLGEVARISRCKGAGITSVPSANKLFAAALDGSVENFASLKNWSGNPFPIATDEDLLLAVLTKLSSLSPLEIISKLSSSLGGNPSYAFIPSGEDSIYAKSGSFPLFAGICDDGCCVSSELGAMSSFAKRYYIIESGECCKITDEKIVIYDRRMRKIKKQLHNIYEAETGDDGYIFTDRLRSLAFGVKDTVGEFVKDSALDFESLRLSRRTISKIKRAVITGSSLSFRAAQLSAYNFEVMTDIPCRAVPSGELRYFAAAYDRETLLVAISENGEDKNAIACVRRAKSLQAMTLAVTSSPSSLLARESDYLINPKLKNTSIPVYAYMSDVMSLTLFTLWLGNKNAVISDLYLSVAIKLAELLTGKVSSAVKMSNINPIPATMIREAKSLFVTGLGADCALSHQAAAEIRSETGKNAVAVSCAQLAYESEALLTDSTVIAFVTNKELMQKSLGYIRRFRSLGADVLIYTTANIENEITDFENIISVTDSLPIFDTLVTLAALEKTVSEVSKVNEADEKKEA